MGHRSSLSLISEFQFFLFTAIEFNFYLRRDLLLLGKIVGKSRNSSLVVDRANAKTIEGSVLRKHEFQCVDQTGFAFTIRRENRQASLLTKVERLGLQISTKALKTPVF